MSPKFKTALSATEIMVLLALAGILLAVGIPYYQDLGRSRHRSSYVSNLRQIGQASLIYANDNSEQLPGLHLTPLGEIDLEATTPDIHAIAAALALRGGLNDAQLWLYWDDANSDVIHSLSSFILEHGKRTMNPEFARSALSVQYVAGLDLEMEPTTPIAFTRGLKRNGYWAADKRISLYGEDGGHIVFIGGNVDFYRNLRTHGGSMPAGLIKPDGTMTSDILEVVGRETRIFSTPATETGAVEGLPGIGSP